MIDLVPLCIDPEGGVSASHSGSDSLWPSSWRRFIQDEEQVVETPLSCISCRSLSQEVIETWGLQSCLERDIELGWYPQKP